MEILISYLLGAIPTAYIYGRIKGLDLRKQGSGNVGATNAWRVLGKKAGIITLIIDILKGVLAVMVVAQFFSSKAIGDPFLRKFICGLAAILGHNFPVYLRFRGGKGVAVSVGVMLGLAPGALGAAFLLWVLIFAAGGYVSLASITAAFFLPVFSVIFKYPPAMHWVCAVFAALVIIRHRTNIKRLLKGEEKRILKRRQ